MAITVVVAVFGMSDLVAHQQHGHALADHQDAQEILDLANAQGVERLVVGVALNAAIPT